MHVLGIYELKDNRVKWVLWEFVSPSHRPAITTWRDSLPVNRRADFDTFFRMLVKLQTWEHPHLKSLQGRPLRNLYELRWKSQGVPHRVGGYFMSPKEFVMLIGFTHNGKKYDPPAALTETILVRRKQLQAREGSLREYQVLVS